MQSNYLIANSVEASPPSYDRSRNRKVCSLKRVFVALIGKDTNVKKLVKKFSNKKQ
jgi:hypothetical protein